MRRTIKHIITQNNTFFLYRTPRPGFIKDMPALIDPLSSLLLLLYGEMDGLLASGAAAALVLGGTGFTLYKKEVTSFIPAVGMCIGRLTTLVTAGDDIIRDTFSQPVIKYKIFSFEFIRKFFFLYHISILYDTTLEVKHILKAIM